MRQKNVKHPRNLSIASIGVVLIGTWVESAKVVFCMTNSAG